MPEYPVIDNEWIPDLKRQRWLCRICGNGRWVESRKRQRHTNSQLHLNNRRHQVQEPLSPVPPHETQRALQDLVDSMGLGSVDHILSTAPSLVEPRQPAERHDVSLQPSLHSPVEYVDDPELLRLRLSADEVAARAVRTSLERMLHDNGVWADDSDDEAEDERSQPEDEFESAAPLASTESIGLPRPRDHSADESQRRDYFPWEEKLSMTLDIITHLPRSVFSDAQLELLLWLLQVNGVDNTPSVKVMKEEQKRLQGLAGIDTRKYKGSLGHPYHVNDIGQIIAQEMANPRVRPYLKFYPEDSGKRLSQAWHGDRWRHKMDPSLLTPMVRVGHQPNFQDYYIFEPAALRDGSACVPVRWIQRKEGFVCLAWRLELSNTREGWILREDQQFIVHQDSLLWSLPVFEEMAPTETLPSPHTILFRVKPNGEYCDTSARKDFTNDWRKKARGRRVLSFLIWLYCDDTSGNVSKKWNKHNSYLFTPAGLPRAHVHHEFNVHFLCTSNLAPPLEMMEGIVAQLDEYQATGIGAYDCLLKEEVLVIPAVLALLGDNPMQSELACHIGLAARLFCRICWVSTGKDASDEEEDDNSEQESRGGGDSRMEVDEDNQSAYANSSAGRSRVSTSKRASGKGRILETVDQMIDRVKRFLKKGEPRTRGDSIKRLHNIFIVGVTPGGATKAKLMKTESGLKDRFADGIMEQVLKIVQMTPEEEVGRVIAEELRKYRDQLGFMSPVWRIKGRAPLPPDYFALTQDLPGLDPHRDTPIEILRVVLLGYLEYFWRDAITRLSERGKTILIARLSSFNVQGLGIPPLAGRTLVQYGKSLTGRDFRAISQAAPFVLHNLDLPQECTRAWMALSALVPLLWQPVIEDRDSHLVEVEAAVHHFLLCTARWTPRWFNKPKFHLLLHLVDHIRDLGPAPLFATEGFESFNALIRMQSVHSNRQAPSRDIAMAFAQMNRLRHLVSGGWFAVREDLAFDRSLAEFVGERPLRTQVSAAGLPSPQPAIERYVYRQFGPAARVVSQSPIVSRYVGFYSVDLPISVGTCTLNGTPAVPWANTKIGGLSEAPSPELAESNRLFKSAKEVVLTNGDKCSPGDWVLVCNNPANTTRRSVGCIIEILQVQGSPESLRGEASYIGIKLAEMVGLASFQDMPALRLTNRVVLARVSDVPCSANVQHNCLECKCKVKGHAPVVEEREKTGRTRPDVTHKAPTSAEVAPWILNMAKMRDAEEIQKFRSLTATRTFDVDSAVRYGVEREVVLRSTHPIGAGLGSTGAANSVDAEGRPQPLRLREIIGSGN